MVKWYGLSGLVWACAMAAIGGLVVSPGLLALILPVRIGQFSQVYKSCRELRIRQCSQRPTMDTTTTPPTTPIRKDRSANPPLGVKRDSSKFKQPKGLSTPDQPIRFDVARPPLAPLRLNLVAVPRDPAV
jgi:hypothetical protein